MPGIWTADHEAVFAAQMQRLGLVFDRRITKELLDLYREELDDIDGDLVVSGVRACVSESRFWPAPDEVRERSGARSSALMQQRIEQRDAVRVKLGSQREKLNEGS